ALADQREAICALGQLSEISVLGPGPRIPRAAAAIRPSLEVVIPLTGVIDFGEEEKRLAKEIAQAEADQALVSRKLENPNFVARAPPDIVEKDRQRIVELTAKLAQLRDYFRIITEPEVIDMSNEDWKFGGGFSSTPSQPVMPSQPSQPAPSAPA